MVMFSTRRPLLLDYGQPTLARNNFYAVRYVTFYFLINIFACCSVWGSAPNPPTLFFNHVLTENGASVGAVEAILKDSKGYMWFGGMEGLVRYDGYNFVKYRNRINDLTSLSSNIVWDIYEDRKSQLWIATDNGLNKYDSKTDSFVIFRHDEENSQTICSNLTRRIAEDESGNLWVATFNGLAMLNAERTSFTNFFHNSEDINSLSGNRIRDILIDRSGKKLWIGHDSVGLNSLDLDSGIVKRYPYGVTDGSGTNYSNIITIFQDDERFIWLGTDGGGLNRLDPSNNQFRYFLANSNNPNGINANSITAITQDLNGTLWVATEHGGLNRMNPKTFHVVHYRHNANEKGSVSSDILKSVYIDNNNDLWLGNFPNGVDFLDSSTQAFRTFKHDPSNPNSLSDSSVLSLHEDDSGGLWIGTEKGGINRLSLIDGKFNAYKHNPLDKDGMSAGAVLGIEHSTTDGTIWFGVWRGGLHKLNPATGKMKVYRSDSTPGSLSNDNVWSLKINSAGVLWIGTIGGGTNRYREASDDFSNYQTQQPSNENFFLAWDIFEDSDNILWIGANEGLARYDAKADHFFFYHHRPSDENSLSFDVVLDIDEDEQGRLWLATRGGGLSVLDKKTGNFSTISQQDGLPDDVIYSLKFDNQGDLWIGSSSGLTRYSIAKNEFSHFDEKNGLQGNQFNIGSAIKLKNGDLAFGGTSGLTIFDPKEISSNKSIPPIAIVDFQLFNKSVVPGAEDSPLDNPIQETEEIVLNHNQTVFSFTFVSMSYRNPEKNRFAYILDGFEEKWNYVDSDRRNATYTNLDAGRYVFRVKAANNHGVWNENEKAVKILILPPPWRTWWAYALYTLVLLSLLFWLLYAQRMRVLVLEAKVKERTAELEAISLSDPLTGSNNRRFLVANMPADVSRVKREYSTFSIGNTSQKNNMDLIFFMVDIDYFKSVNDVYGHAAGDQLLLQFSHLLKISCRQSDYIVRWGGEEFLIVSRFTNRSEAQHLAERIRKNVEENTFVLNNGIKLNKTCSIGYACFPFIEKPEAYEPELTWEQVIELADQAAYIAKRSGRNLTIGLRSTRLTKTAQLAGLHSKDLKALIDSKELSILALASMNINLS